MTKSSASTISFTRKFIFDDDKIIVINNLVSEANIIFLRVGGQFASRYVPQSRYFQLEELANKYWDIKNTDLTKLIKITCNFTTNDISLNQD